MNDLYLITYNTMFFSLHHHRLSNPNRKLPMVFKERKKSNENYLLWKMSLFFVEIFFFLFLCGFQWENFFPYSMMRETFFFFAFISSSTPLFFPSSMVCEWVLLNFFSRVSLFYVQCVKCSVDCRTVNLRKQSFF